jgi:hypothetical protein
MASLANQLAAKMKAAGLNLTKAAAATKVSLPSFRATLAGKSAPNARSVGKYAAFLGISPEAVMAAAGRKVGKAKTAKGKPGRRGRPPGKKAKKGKPGRRGRPPGKKAKGKPGRPKATGPSKGAIRDLFAALKTAQSKFARLLKAAGKLK